MPGKNPSQAVEAFLAPLQRAVSCVSTAQWTTSVGGRTQLRRPHSLTWNQRKPVPLKRIEGPNLGLKLAMRYEIIHVPGDHERGPYAVRTLAYEYSIHSDDGTVQLSYHWHPFGESSETEPHLHIGAVALTPHALMTRKAHLPTARISLEQVLRVCIGELGVIAVRDDWQQVLADSEDVFKLWRTWS